MAKDLLYLIRRSYEFLRDYPQYCKKRKQIKEKYAPIINQHGKAPFVFFVLTPTHTNLGDHAIALAVQDLLHKNGIAYTEITLDQLYELNGCRLLSMMNGHPILINGGGNLGTLWPDVEITERAIIKSCRKSSIFILPNTIYYEDSDYGRKELEKALALYKKAKGLTIYLREENSYHFLEGKYKNIRLMPDMVLRLSPKMKDYDRKGCLLCLRKDLEKTLSKEDEGVLKDELADLFGENVVYTDTHAVKNVPVAKREEKVFEKLEEFRRAELVVTDRLHGMIFCAITGTPCVVIDSKSPKVKGCYRWIENLPYVTFAEDVVSIKSACEKVHGKGQNYDNSDFLHYFDSLGKEIVKLCRK